MRSAGSVPDGELRREIVSRREEPELRIGAEDLLERRDRRHRRKERERPASHQRIPDLALLDDDARGHRQRDTREHLVRDAEQRPQDVDAAVRIDHADVEEVTPARHDQRARKQRSTDTTRYCPAASTSARAGPAP